MTNDAIIPAVASQRFDTSNLALKLQNQEERAVTTLIEQAVAQVEESNATVERKPQQRLADFQI